MIPQISGLDALKIIRGYKSFLELPIILISTKTKPQILLTVLKIGANEAI